MRGRARGDVIHLVRRVGGVPSGILEYLKAVK